MATGIRKIRGALARRWWPIRSVDEVQVKAAVDAEHIPEAA
jgi:hypothetical protein